MSEVRNLERRNSKVFMVYDLDSTNLRYPVQKLIIMSAIHPETGSDDFIAAVGSLPNLNEVTDSVWCEMGQFDYDGVEYNVYGTVIHPLSVTPESFLIFVQPNVEKIKFNLMIPTRATSGHLSICGSKEDILDEYITPVEDTLGEHIIPVNESGIRKLCRAYINKCNNDILPSNITRTLISIIPEKYKRPIVIGSNIVGRRSCNENSQYTTYTARPISGYTPVSTFTVESAKKSIKVKTFKTAIQDQRLMIDDDEIAEWIGDRELVSIDSVVSDNKLIRTVIVKI